MLSRRLIVALTCVVSLICVYYLSFTYVAFQVEREATLHATNPQGKIDFAQRQAYLASVWDKPVYNWLGLTYTYEEVKERALGLGLDLQGGMHVTLEVSPVAIIKGLAGDSKDEAFLQALSLAQQQQETHPQISFTTLFHQAYLSCNPSGKLSTIFATAANRDRFTHSATDKEILNVIAQEIDQAIARSFEIIRTRIDRFGTSQPNLQRLPGSGRIQLELPGVNNPERVRKLLQGVAQLCFWEVHDMETLGKTFEAVDRLLVATAPDLVYKDMDQKESRLADERTSAAHVQRSMLMGLLKSDHGLVYAVSDVPIINQILAREDVKALLPDHITWLWDSKPHLLPDGTQVVMLYPAKQQRGGHAALMGDVITTARLSFDERGQPSVHIQMNRMGARAWKRITANNIHQRIAITLDGYVYSAPVVNMEIPNGSSQITGNFSIEEAKDLANILNTGSLPAPVTIVEEAIVGPTLGQQAQMAGLVSMLVGLSLVVIFMMIYYARGGLIANLALCFNLLFMMGILTQLGAVLTLPGIAGIVLTIGMSIDANVLIFERIREELASGSSMQVAVDRGYQKAYSSIIDSNVTTFLTGAVLYVLGQGPVRGFATTLMIGIVSSLFSAVLITRVMIDSIVRSGLAHWMTFSYTYSRHLFRDLRINFIKMRRLSYVGSLIFIGLGFSFMVRQGGLNLGVDFTGGRAYVVAFGQPEDPSALKMKLSTYLGDPGIEVKTYGANHVLKITTSYLMRDVAEASSDVDEQVRDTLTAGIMQATGLTQVESTVHLPAMGTFAIVRTAKVGASIAHDIQAAAQRSVAFSLLIIFLYILVRFRRWYFGLAAVVALFHDTLAILAAFAMAGALGYVYEVDQVFIAAVLTVIGYSINDTVVVFDRLREHMYASKRSTLQQVANRSINETMSRTMITSLTTLIAVTVLFVYGGAVLRSFSFSLLIGVIFGTYSSVFIATPLALDFANWAARTRRKNT